VSDRFPHAFEVLRSVNIESIEVVTLTKLIRSKYNMSLTDSLNMARLVKEAYRLGVIRGQVVNINQS